MTLVLRIELIVFVIVFLVLVLFALYKEKLRLKYALLWLFAGFLMLCATLIPNFIEQISRLLGFETASNMIFLAGFIIVLGISFALTIVVSNQSQKIKLLVQEVSMLKSLGGKDR